jgi:membrane associated rhomboid family serine protease
MTEWRAPRREPVFNAPGMVLALAALMLTVHTLLAWLPTAEADRLFVDLALVPARYGPLAEAVPGYALAPLASWLTHMVVHADWAHLLINGGWLLAFGSAVARRCGGPAMLALFVVSGLAGGALYVGLHFGELASLVGASGGLSGLMGGAFRFMFRADDPAGGLLGRDGSLVHGPLMSVREALADRRVATIVAAWLAVNLALGLIPSGIIVDGSIAWEAHLGGFLAGFLGMGLFDRRRTARVD